jgi:hypothetical protein
MIRKSAYLSPMSLAAMVINETVSMACEYSRPPVACRLPLENKKWISP